MFRVLGRPDSKQGGIMSNGIQYQIIGGSGGVIIDPSGSSSAVHALQETFGDRMDWLTCWKRSKSGPALLSLKATKPGRLRN